MSLNDIDTALAPYIPKQQLITGRNITLDRTRRLMAILDNPQQNLKIIHIAGTSGKTSTTYYIASLLTAAGKKVGMTVSPHVDSITERLQINMKPLSVQEFGNALQEFLNILQRVDIRPTYFELLIAFVYWYFAKVGVDYAVIETGLGGLHDSTNVADNRNKICVITDIGYDHMHVLGHTLPEIAAQKAGIIHEQNTVVMYEQSPEVMAVFRSQCKKTSAHLILAEHENDAVTVGLPEFQRRNWHLAYAAYNIVRQRDELPLLDKKVLKNSTCVQVPARMDVRKINGKQVVMDGAHNGQKMRAFVDGIKKRWPHKKAAVLLSLKLGKEYEDVLPIVAEIADSVIITTFSQVQDTPVSSIEPQKLAQYVREAGVSSVRIIEGQDKAYKELFNSSNDLLIITGSFYLIGQLRQKFKELQHV